MTKNEKKTRSKAARSMARPALLLGGCIFFLIGLVGVFLPVLPTTVFWIIAALLFAKSSPRMYQKIRDWPKFGPIVVNLLDHGIIAREAKVAAAIGMAIGTVVFTFFDISLEYKIALYVGVAFALTFVLSRPETPTGETSSSGME
jgi:uncharacterized protein